MRRSRADKAETHERILEIAARRVRAQGPDSLSISELMAEAELTHGGFYKHFESRDALVRAAVARAASGSPNLFPEPGSASATDAVAAVVKRYLSVRHRDASGQGCAIAALATDVSRQPDAELAAPVRTLAERGFARMNGAFGGGEATEEEAVFAWSAMVGALLLSRVFRDDPRSEQILDIARRQIVEMAERSSTAETGAT